MGQHSSPKLSVLYWSMDVYPGTLALAWYSWYNPQTPPPRVDTLYLSISEMAKAFNPASGSQH